MRSWIRFFLGTPRRFLWTMSVPGAVFAYYRPDVVQQAVFNLLNAVFAGVAPFFGPLLMLGIIWFGFKMILGGFKKRR